MAAPRSSSCLNHSMLRAWRTKPRSSVRKFIDKPHQFWILPLFFLVLGPVIIVSDVVKGNFGWRMVVNVTLVAVIGSWLFLWLRRPTSHDR